MAWHPNGSVKRYKIILKSPRKFLSLLTAASPAPFLSAATALVLTVSPAVAYLGVAVTGQLLL